MQYTSNLLGFMLVLFSSVAWAENDSADTMLVDFVSYIDGLETTSFAVRVFATRSDTGPDERDLIGPTDIRLMFVQLAETNESYEYFGQRNDFSATGQDSDPVAKERRVLKNKSGKYSRSFQISHGWFGDSGPVTYPIPQDMPGYHQGNFGMLELLPFPEFCRTRIVPSEALSFLMSLKLTTEKRIDEDLVLGSFVLETNPSVQQVFVFSKKAGGRPVKMEINFLNFNGKAVQPLWKCELTWKVVAGVMRQCKSTSQNHSPTGNIDEIQMEIDWIVGLEELKKKNVDKLLHRGYNFDSDTFDVGLPLDEAVFNLFEKE